MSLFIVDVESDGPAPGLYSMVSFGVVRVDRALDHTFFGQTAPITDQFDPEALAISAISREQHEAYPLASVEMIRLAQWIEQHNTSGKPVMVSDNPAFDFQFMSFYCHKYVGHNPFGHSARRVGDFCAGLEKGWSQTQLYRELGMTPHTHHPVNDAKRVAEGLIALADRHGIILPGVDPIASKSTLGL